MTVSIFIDQFSYMSIPEQIGLVYDTKAPLFMIRKLFLCPVALKLPFDVLQKP